MKKICCVNDMPGVGKIALSAMSPILSINGIDVSYLPTALVSNTLDFGKFDILDTSDYMNKTVDVWNELGFKFDCISTGFMINPKQIEIVEKLINNHQDKKDLLVVVDPIMGDDGNLYNGIDESNVSIMRKLSSYADILIPNYTEACFLTDLYKCKNSITKEEAKYLIDKTKTLGCKSVVITSVVVDNKHFVIGYDNKLNKYFNIEYDYIDVRFPGTGDIFSAALISNVLNGKDLFDSTKHAMEIVKEIILNNIDKKEKFYGVDIERYISERKL